MGNVDANDTSPGPISTAAIFRLKQLACTPKSGREAQGGLGRVGSAGWNHATNTTTIVGLHGLCMENIGAVDNDVLLSVLGK